MALKTFQLACLLAVVSFLSACSVTVQDTAVLHPFHERPIQDPRPQLQFSTAAPVDGSQYLIYVNTLYVGTVADFKENSRPLRLLSGTYQVSIERHEELILTEDLVLKDGTQHVLHIPNSGGLVMGDINR